MTAPAGMPESVSAAGTVTAMRARHTCTACAPLRGSTGGRPIRRDGRSDATINRQGVRIGSGEIYDVVDQLDQVHDSLIVGIELDDGGYWMPLFVVPTAPVHDPDTFVKRTIRHGVSPDTSPTTSSSSTPCPTPAPGRNLKYPSNGSCKAPTRRPWSTSKLSTLRPPSRTSPGSDPANRQFHCDTAEPAALPLQGDRLRDTHPARVPGLPSGSRRDINANHAWCARTAPMATARLT